MLIEIEEQKVDFKTAWFDYKDGVKLQIAGINKPSFNRALELNGIQAEQELNGIKEVTDESAIKSKAGFNSAVSHLLLGWTGFVDPKKTPIEYSPQQAELICTSSKQSFELVMFILAKAKELRDQEQKEIVDEVGKSSSTTSKSVSSGVKKKPRKSTKSLV